MVDEPSSSTSPIVVGSRRGRDPRSVQSAAQLDAARPRRAHTKRSSTPSIDPEELRYAPREPRRYRWLKRAIAVVVVAAVCSFAAGAVAYSWTQDQYYVAEHDGKVAIYQGVQADLPGRRPALGLPRPGPHARRAAELSSQPGHRRHDGRRSRGRRAASLRSSTSSPTAAHVRQRRHRSTTRNGSPPGDHRRQRRYRQPDDTDDHPRGRIRPSPRAAPVPRARATPGQRRTRRTGTAPTHHGRHHRWHRDWI